MSDSACPVKPNGFFRRLFGGSKPEAAVCPVDHDGSGGDSDKSPGSKSTESPAPGKKAASPYGAANPDHTAPETLEGWWVLHDLYHIDWTAWRALSEAEQQAVAQEFADWIEEEGTIRGTSAEDREGDSAAYRIVGQKADICLLHYRRTPSDLNAVERRLRQLKIFALLTPVYGYLSIIEASLYEATAIAHKNLAQKGMNPTVEGWQPAFDQELAKQKNRLQERVYRAIPEQEHVCFYPMSKRRGEQVNWYDMTLEERRGLMRSHGRLGHKYHDKITQVVSGSTGLDDWEWAVDLHGDDPLQFKKLVYEMRFDPASSRFALFGDFYIGLKTPGDALKAFLIQG